MPWPVHPTGFFGARGDNDTYRIERSLRFNSDDSAYLNRTPASAGNLTTWTWSGWVKRGSLGSQQFLFSADRAASSEGFGIQFTSSDTLQIYAWNGSAFVYNYITTQVFRDVSSWYHIVVTLDTTNATSTDRVRIYVNGSRITGFGTSTAPSQNATGYVNATQSHALGRSNYSTSLYFDGYLTEINFIDGQALTPSSFGETDAITGRWKAKAYSGTYGTNGFYLKFADNSGTTSTTLGKDSSPNGNNWTPNNFSVTAGVGNDSLVDSPTNYGTDTGVGGEVRGNYATFNPLETASGLSDGNLRYTGQGSSRNANFLVTSGKWYFEGTVVSIGGATERMSIFYSNLEYKNTGQKTVSGVVSNYGSSFTTNDIIGVAINWENTTATFYKNGVSQGALSFTSDTLGYISFYAFNTSDIWAINFGQRPFAYTAPTGFKALCTTNLPQPTIQKPSRYMDVVAYTGTGASNSISSLGFSPDLVWIKNRGGATDHALYDTTRGTQAQLSSNTTGSEVTSSTGLTAFGTNGFTIGTSSLVNTSGTQYIAWAWDEAPIAGMDIVSFTGTGATQNISHSLGVAPKMVIYKCRNTAVTSWVVGHSSVNSGSSPWNYYMVLNTTDAQALSSSAWNNTAPTSTQFTVGGPFTPNTFTYIAYLFAEVEGFSKFGSYTGNGSADGPFVFTGMRSRWIMIKRTDTAGNSWVIHDTARDSINLASIQILANTSDAETNTDVTGRDILSNGFKIRGTNAGVNASGATYIFAAFAESPFKYARAR